MFLTEFSKNVVGDVVAMDRCHSMSDSFCCFFAFLATKDLPGLRKRQTRLELWSSLSCSIWAAIVTSSKKQKQIVFHAWKRALESQVSFLKKDLFWCYCIPPKSRYIISIIIFSILGPFLLIYFEPRRRNWQRREMLKTENEKVLSAEKGAERIKPKCECLCGWR